MKEKKPCDERYSTKKDYAKKANAVGKETLKRYSAPSFKEIAEELKRREK